MPFGADGPENLVGDWHSLQGRPSPLSANQPPHGLAPTRIGAGCWVESGPGTIVMALDYPSDHSIARVEREITPGPATTAIDLILRVIPRADCHLPIGLHPTFALPMRMGMRPRQVMIQASVAR